MSVCRCVLEEITPGMVLASPVIYGTDSVLVQQGVELNERLLDLLRSRGVDHVYVQTGDMAGVPTATPNAIQRVVSREEYRFGSIEGNELMTALRDTVVTIKAKRPDAWELDKPRRKVTERMPDRREEIHALAKRIQDLPTLPAVYHQIDKVTRDESASAADVAKVVTSDPVFSASLLRVANSALYSRSEAVTTVTGAVSLLGHKVIRDLCLITSVLEIISLAGRDSQPVDMFWKHAVGVGSVAHVIGKRVPAIPPEEMFLAGLLHDIGQLFWIRYFPDDLALIYAHAEDAGQTLLESERDLMGTVHTRLGKMIANHWNLPKSYVEVISSHHSPNPANGWHLLCQVVNVADAIAHAIEMSGPLLCRVPTIHPEAWAALRLDLDGIGNLVDEALAEFESNKKNFALFAEEETVS